jgi:hypothetical protein
MPDAMSLTADGRLVLVRVKIERAKKHLKELESDLLAFGDKHFGVFVAKPDPNAPGGLSSDFKTPRAFPIDVLSAAGDVVQNLRTSLDHLANQLVWVGTGKESSRQIAFPIAESLDEYESQKVRKVKGMRIDAIEAIDALKPYKGGNDALWRIHELNNIDKHRTLFTVSEDCYLFADWLPTMMGERFPFLLKAESPHFAGVFDPDVENNVDFEVAKALSDPQVMKGDALLPSLHQLVDFVDDLSFAFKPLLA